MDELDISALSIAIDHSTNHVVNEMEFWKNISLKLANSKSTLSKIFKLIEKEKDFNLNECFLDKELMHQNNCIIEYKDFVKEIDVLQKLGISIILVPQDKANLYNEIAYLSWSNELCPMELEFAKLKNRAIYFSKSKKNFVQMF